MKPQEIVNLALDYFYGKDDSMAEYLGYTHSQDYSKAFELFQEAAKKRKSVAYMYLGEMYRDGLGIEKNYDLAKKWFTRADKSGHEFAILYISTIDNIIGAENGDLEAMWKLANDYMRGSYISLDINEALRWYRTAAENGHVKSQESLGYIYYKGKDVPLNIPEAIRWFELAAEEYSSMANYFLGCIYLRGKGVEKDIDLAEDYLNSSDEFGTTDLLNAIRLMRASEKGDKQAQRDLAFEYATSEALGYDWSEAARLLKLAIAPKEITSAHKIIADFIIAHDDSGQKGDYKIYKPTWHPRPMSFWFNPPIPEDEDESHPCVSGDLVLVDEGIIVVEDYNSGQYHLLDECLGNSIETAVYAIQKYSGAELLRK